MIDRDDLGSWLTGPQSQRPSDDWPGKRLSLPEFGPGSVAPLFRRFFALLIDWSLCMIIASVFFDFNELAILLLFAVENFLLVATIGSTVGHRIVGIQVIPVPAPGRTQRQARYVGFLRSAIRTVLVALVVPAAIFNSDHRGLHDLAAGTVIVVRR